MSQALYRKYRPRNWSEVIGQDHVVQTLQHAITADRVGHAYLFAGPRGTGKTTVARIFARAVNCLTIDPAQKPCNECENCRSANEGRFMDLIEMDAASNTGVDDVRDLRDKIGFSPTQGRYKIYIIDEVHMLSTAAFNALLKTLEEPPPHAIFILATTEIHKIPPTVLSRCQRHEFRRVSVDDILGNLRQVAGTEGLSADDDALALIARQATGSIRDAQSLLDQMSSTGPRITMELTQAVLGTATSQTVIDLMDSIQDGLPARALQSLHAALDAGADARSLARQLVEYLRGLMLVQLGNGDQVEASKETKRQMDGHARVFSAQQVMRMLRAFNAAALDTRGSGQASLALELALAEALEQVSAAAAGGPSTSGGVRTGTAPGGDSQASPSGGSAFAWGAAAAVAPAVIAREESRHQVVASLGLAGSPKVDDARGPTAGALAGIARDPSPDLGKVAKSWKDIRAAIKPKHPGVAALLNSCKPVDLRGDELLLGFQSETVRALMDKPENVEVARRAVLEVLGLTVRIRCVVANARGKLPPDVPHDGMVATALNHGGEIVDVQD